MRSAFVYTLYNLLFLLFTILVGCFCVLYSSFSWIRFKRDQAI
ncbi:MAG: hypothetical protein ACJ76F_05305 [Bacteroidia bacterium]